MKKLICLFSILCLFMSMGATAQQVNAPEVRYRVEEEWPKYHFNVNQFVSIHVQYPEQALKDSVDARVLVDFVVNEDGSISDVHAERSSKFGYGFEDEAERIVKLFPKFTPGRKNGVVVKYDYRIPIQFYYKK